MIIWICVSQDHLAFQSLQNSDSNWSCKKPNNQGTSSEIQSNLSSIEPSNDIYIQLYPMTSSLKLRTSTL